MSRRKIKSTDRIAIADAPRQYLTAQVRLAESNDGDSNPPIEMDAYTGATVRRYGLFEDYDLQMTVSDEAIDFSRVDSGRAPFYQQSNAYGHGEAGLSDVVGTITSHKIESGTLKLSVQPFGESELSDQQARNLRKLRSGGAVNMSIGVTPLEITRTIRKGDVDLYTYTRWSLDEVTHVAEGADPNAAATRYSRKPAGNETGEFDPASLWGEEGQTMSANNHGDTAAEVRSDSSEQELAEARAEGMRLERERQTGVRAMAAQFSKALSIEFVDAMVADGACTAADAGQRILAELARQQAANPIDGVRTGDDVFNPSDRKSALTDALAVRLSVSYKPANDAFRQFAGASLIEMARECLMAAGYRMPRFDRDATARLALHTTSDFPGILADSINKIMLPSYQKAAPAFREFFSQRTFRDFRDHSFLRLSDFPQLLEVDEQGEIKGGSMLESAETASLSTYGRRIGVTRQTLVNDDLGVLQSFATMIGPRVAFDEDRLAFAMLNLASGTGPLMADAKRLIHADHGNRAGTPATIDVTSVTAGRLAMRTQTDLRGDAMGLAPAILVCGPAKETVAEQFLSTLVLPTSDANINTFKGRLRLVVSHHLTGNEWYLIADPAMNPALIYGYLEGNEGPRVESRQGFEIEGIEIRVAHDFGVGAVDYRGLYRNAGA